MKENIWCVSRQSIVIFVAFCLWIVPTYLYSNVIFMSIANAFGYAAIFLFLIDFFRNPKKCSVIFWLILLSCVVLGISTVRLNPELLSTYIRYYAKITAFCYFLDKMTRSSRGTKNINVLLHYLELMIFINLITLILFPNGMYSSGAYSRNYWMGYDNTHIRWQIPALAISFIYSFVTRKKITARTWGLIFIVLISTVLIEAGTATVAVVVFSVGILYILIGKHKDKERGIKFFNPLFALGIGIIGSIIVVGGTVLGSQIGVVAQFSSLLGKDSATLTGRSYIWINALTVIKNNLVWGLGYETSDMTSLKLVNKIGYGSSPHNLCLEVLYNGGIVLAFVIILIYIVLHLILRKYKEVPLVSVCGLWLLIISIMGITEPQYSSQLRIAWIIIGNIPYLCRENGLIIKERKRKIV